MEYKVIVDEETGEEQFIYTFPVVVKYDFRDTITGMAMEMQYGTTIASFDSGAELKVVRKLAPEEYKGMLAKSKVLAEEQPEFYLSKFHAEGLLLKKLTGL